MMMLRVQSVADEAERIRSYVLVHPDAIELPPFEPGAHVEVIAPGGLARQYSLCDSPVERGHYRIAVLDAPNGRGGSRAMHEQLHVGDLIPVSAPRNFFRLHDQARHSVLIAGGIGITPIICMVDALRRRGASFELHYCSESAPRTAFLDRLAPVIRAGNAIVHHDGADPARHLDVGRLLRCHEPGTHLYFCGPAGLMGAIRAAAAHWPAPTVHWEYFGASGAPAAGAEIFRIRLARSERWIPIRASETILQALRDAGIAIPTSCEAGLCGTCKVRYLAGQPRHDDYVLSDDEKSESVLVCCATVEDASLVLDL